MKQDHILADLPEVLPRHKPDIALLDLSDPQSVVNKVPEKLAEAILALPKKYFKMSERQLRSACNPNEIVARMRLTFWDEYYRVAGKKNPMVVSNITRGVCFRDYFYEDILTDEKWFAYVCTPPKDYVISMREMLDLGLDELREVIELPNVKRRVVRIKNAATGEFEDVVVEEYNTRVISQKITIVKMLDERVKGSTVQRVQIDQRNLNIAATTKKDPLEQLSPQQVMELSEQLKNEPQVIDVEGTDRGAEAGEPESTPGDEA